MQILRRITGAIEELTSSTVGLIVFSLAVGIVLAMIFILVQQYAVGGFVRRLRGRGADSRESAATLSELGVRRNIFVLAALGMSESALRRVVLAAEQYPDEPSEAARDDRASGDKPAVGMRKKKKNRAKKQRIRVRSAHWYIPEDKSAKAEALFGKERVNPVLLVISIAILLVLMYLLIPAIPNIIELAGAMLAA